MARLGEAHIEQIKTLRAEGKTAPEIVEIMTKTYPGVTFAPYHVYSVIKSAKKDGAPVARAKHYKKRAKPAAQVELPIEEVVNDISKLIVDIKAAYAVVIRGIRIELLKSLAEVRAIRNGEGIPDK
jgi:hypothetical protein